MACLFAAAVGVARAEQSTLARVEAQGPRVKRWAGWVLIGVGGWFLVLALFADFFARVFPV
jgi:hypothetical protein